MYKIIKIMNMNKGTLISGVLLGVTVFGIARLLGELDGSFISSIESDLDYIALNRRNIVKTKNNEHLSDEQKAELINIYETCIKQSKSHISEMKSSYPILWRWFGYDLLVEDIDQEI